MQQYSIYFREETKPLSKEELNNLFSLRDTLPTDSDKYKEILSEIALRNLRLVPKFAQNRYKDLELDDLAPIGFDALVKAAAKYDMSMNKSFASYAKLWILTELDRKAQEEFMPSHTSKRDYALFKTYHVKLQELVMEMERMVSFDEVVKYMNLTPKQIEKLDGMLLLSDIKSLDNAINDDDDAPFSELIPSNDKPENDGVAIIQNTLTNIEYSMLIEKGEGMSLNKIASLHNLDIDEAKNIIKEAILKVNSEAIREALRYRD